MPETIRLLEYTDSTIFNVIDEIQKHPMLYYITASKRSSPDAITRRNEVWNNISSLFGLPVSEVRSIWNKLRASFCRHFKMYQTTKNSKKPYNPNNWKYFDSLLFLIPYLESVGERANQQPWSSSSAATKLAKKALKRSKTTLMKTTVAPQEAASSDLIDTNESEVKSEINVGLLIQLVKQHPILYEEPAVPANALQRSAAWAAIGNELNISSRRCIDKWHSLLMYLRTLSKRSDQDRIKWKWYADICFVVPYKVSQNHFQSTPTKLVENEETSDKSPTVISVSDNFSIATPRERIESCSVALDSNRVENGSPSPTPAVVSLILVVNLLC